MSAKGSSGFVIHLLEQGLHKEINYLSCMLKAKPGFVFFPYEWLFQMVWFHGKLKPSQQEQYYLARYCHCPKDCKATWGRSSPFLLLKFLGQRHCPGHVRRIPNALKMVFVFPASFSKHPNNTLSVLTAKRSFILKAEVVWMREARQGPADARPFWLSNYTSWIFQIQKYKTPKCSRIQNLLNTEMKPHIQDPIPNP